MFNRKPKVCEACGVPSSGDVLLAATGPRLLCRADLVGEFAQSFLSYEDRMIVCHPYLRSSSDEMYPYYPLSRFREFSFLGRRKLLSLSGYDDSDRTIVGQWLDSLDGASCQSCGGVATVRYFPEEALIYDGSGPSFGRFAANRSACLCRQDALDRVSPTLQTH